MNRKKFLHTSLLATGAYFLPNVVLALDKPNKKKIADLLPERMLVAQPDYSDYKYNSDGEVFIHTQLSFYDEQKQLVHLPERHYLTQDGNGYGCPTLYYDGTNYFVFVTTLFKSYKMDGFVYKYNRSEGFAKQKIYQHENMGWYAFWGQNIDHKPTLYHYNYANVSMMRSQPLAADNWETERIYICPPEEAILLYQNQLKDVNYHTQAHQFGFTYPKITDGFYQYLKFLYQIDEFKKTTQKDIEAAREAQSPTVWTSKRVPTTIREIRNRQSLASETGGCGCADKLDMSQASDKHIRLLKITNTKAEAIIHGNLSYYPTTIGYYDRNNSYYKLPETFYCLADNVKSHYPSLSYEGENYQINVASLQTNSEQHYLSKICFSHNTKTGFSNEINTHNNTTMPANADAGINSMDFFEVTKQDGDNYSIDKYENYKSHINYHNPFPQYPALQPVYCEGDDLTYATPKPTVLYREVPGTKIEIANMPAYQTQDAMGECRAFSMGTVLQHFICKKFYKVIPDCKNIPPEYSLSYFGLMVYTHAQEDVAGVKIKTFDPFGDSFNSMYQILLNVNSKRGSMLLDSCQPFGKLIESFTKNGLVYQENQEKFDAFEKYIKKIYADWKSKKDTNSEPTNTEEMLSIINYHTGATVNWEQLKAALMKETFGEYMYTLFFESLDPVKCKKKNLPAFYTIYVYPDDSVNASPLYIKNKIIEGLKRSAPVLTPVVCLKWDDKIKCGEGYVHSMVVSGYKRVVEANNPKAFKDLFKVHNSWGPSWQKYNNDGWVDADAYSINFGRIPETQKISSASVIWLE